MADHFQAHPHGRMTPEQRLRDPFMHQMRDLNFPPQFMNNNGMDIHEPHLFRSSRHNFPSGQGFDDGFNRGFKVEDHPSPLFNRREGGGHVESIPIKVIHEKSPSSGTPPPQHQKHHPFVGGRKTTEIPLPSGNSETLSGSPRLERAHSEPPKSFHQRMSTLIPPQQQQQTIPEKVDEEQQNPITTSASAPSVAREASPSVLHQGEQPIKQPPSLSTGSPLPTASSPSDQPQIRHIPIVVEGRDGPVFSRKFSNETRPKVSEHPSSKPAEPTTPQGPPPGPIPMGCSADHLKPLEPSSPLPLPEGPIPLPYSPNLAKEEKQEPEANSSANKDTPDGTSETEILAPEEKTTEEPQQPDCTADPALEKVKSIQDNLAEITRRIEEFKGNKKDKEYLYLDEMLTRHLLSLDGIDSGGKEEIRKIRKESIKSVNRCLSLLDSKAVTSGA